MSDKLLFKAHRPKVGSIWSSAEMLSTVSTRLPIRTLASPTPRLSALLSTRRQNHAALALKSSPPPRHFPLHWSLKPHFSRSLSCSGVRGLFVSASGRKLLAFKTPVVQCGHGRGYDGGWGCLVTGGQGLRACCVSHLLTRFYSTPQESGGNSKG